MNFSLSCSLLCYIFVLEASPLIENTADCQYALRFVFYGKDMKAIEIHQQVSEVYGANVMSDGMVQHWVRASKDGHTNVHHEERSGRCLIITDNLVKKVDEKVRENRCFTILLLSNEFPVV